MCEKCNSDEEGRRKRELVSLEEVREEASIYVGESARSLQERARDHWSDLKSKNEDSHMYKHWLTSHGKDPEPPEFRIRVVKFCTSALVRQIGEATRILLRKNVLNSRAGYNRSGVARLTLGTETFTNSGWMEKTNSATLLENEGRQAMSRRADEEEAEDTNGMKRKGKEDRRSRKKRKSKKLKYARIEN